MSIDLPLPSPSTAAPDPLSIPKSKRRSTRLLTPPDWRKPDWLDGLAFFVGLPAGIAFVFSLVGIRLINGLPYWQGFTYMLLHMAIAWWSVSIGASVIKFSFRSWQPPVIAICTLGFLISLIPAGFIFQRLGDFYSSISPVFAANRADAAMPSWHLDYLVHFIRYSIPALPLYLAGIFGYRFITGVNWFGYPAIPDIAVKSAGETATLYSPAEQATAALIDGTRLPPDAVLLGIKAEQHYIKIWSDKGNDLVRYRFKDLEAILEPCNGLQVHRSWWVNLEKVQKVRNNGRKLELLISDELVVPVSAAYRNIVQKQLGKRMTSAH
jgi:hypothetical protein